MRERQKRQIYCTLWGILIICGCVFAIIFDIDICGPPITLTDPTPFWLGSYMIFIYVLLTFIGILFAYLFAKVIYPIIRIKLKKQKEEEVEKYQNEKYEA